MRLPGADYTRGVKSLGRIGPGTAYDAHAREVLLSQTAQNAVIQEFQKAGAATQDWLDARDATAAELALADYRSKIRDIETKLDTSPVIATKDIPEGIQVKRTITEGGEQVEKAVLPTWQVRAQLFDQAEQKARTDALSQVSGKYRGKLLASITEYGGTAAQQQAQKAFAGEHAYLTGVRNASIETAVQRGDITTAENLIRSGVDMGIYSFDAGREMTTKVNVEHETLSYSRAIASAQTPEQLEALSLHIPAQAQWLSPAQQFALTQTAENQAAVLENKRTAAFEKATTQASAQRRADATLQIASSGKPISWDVIATMDLKPSDRTALIAVNKAASETRSQHSDPGVTAEIQASIFDLSTPNPAPIHTRRQQLQDRITSELDAGRITATDASTLYGRVQSTEGDLFTNEAYKTALDMGYTQIVGTVKSAGFGNATGQAKQRAVDFELNMRQAVQGGADPIQWVQDNVVKYQDPKSLPWVTRDKGSRTIDRSATRAGIKEDYRAGRITAETARAREAELEIIR